MTKKFLLTGAAGFVAGYFIEYLQRNQPDFTMTAIDIADDYPGLPENIRYRKVNLTNQQELVETLKEARPDYIVHLASISSVSESWNNPRESFVNNTNIFLNLAEAVRELRLKTRLLSVGSSEEYGNYPMEKMPLREEYELHPSNPYSVARTSQEQLSRLYANSLGVDIVMTRSFNHIGPRQRDTFVISSFVKQLVEIAKGGRAPLLHVGNVEIIRDFLDVRDVVDAYWRILERGTSGEVYNVCSGHGRTLRDIIGLVAGMLRLDVELQIDAARIRPTDNMVIVGDNTKLMTELQWRASYSLDQSIRDMIAWYSKNS